MSGEIPANISVPVELIKRLLPMMEQMGISVPGLDRVAPSVSINTPPRGLASELGRIAAPRNLFARGKDLLTVEPDGEQLLMKPARFVTWIAEFVTLYEGSGKGQRECGMSRELATLVLESDIFKGCLRKLDAVHTVRLPVLRADGTCELLPPGYDAGSRVFTVPTLDYETDWEFQKAKAFLDAQLCSYPWSEGGDLHASRSVAVQVAAIVGTYCRAFFPPGTPRPMIAYLANQPGTGKSTLVSMALTPVFGIAHANKTPKDDEVMDKELETVAQSMQPFLFFDDIGGGIFSNPLNRFITSRAHSGRKFNSNSEMFKVPCITQVFATGNGIKVSPDLMRRSLIVDLFLATDVRGRKFDHVINADGLAKPETRKQFLSACHALVRQWQLEDYHRHPEPVESFEEWTAIVGGIVQCAGYADPLSAPDLPAGGDEEGTEFRELFCRLASELEKDEVFKRPDLVDRAREWGLLEELVGPAGASDLNSKENIRLGRRMEKWRGRELVDERGRRFTVGHRRQKSGATYPLHFVELVAEGTVVAPSEAVGLDVPGSVAVDGAFEEGWSDPEDF